MSKSLGNVVDPLAVCTGISLQGLHDSLKEGNLAEDEIARAVEGQKRQFPKEGIPECGVDALRFGLCSLARSGKDINLNVLVIYGYRTFCNKVWNAVKLVMMQIGDGYKPDASIAATNAMDRWIRSRLAFAVSEVNANLKAYDFVAATTTIYNLWLYEFCGVYLEYSKIGIQDESRAAATRQTLYFVAETALRLLAPFMPFLTEELWQRLPRQRLPNDLVDPISISVSAYPVDFAGRDEDLEARFASAQGVYQAINSLRSECGLASNLKPNVVVTAADAESEGIVTEFTDIISAIGKPQSLVVNKAGSPRPDGAAPKLVKAGEVFMVVKG